MLSKIPPRPGGYPRTRELFPRDTGGAFDPISPAAVAADITVGFMLTNTRASRLVAQKAVNSALPGLAEVIDRLIATTFDAATRSPYEAEIKRAVQQVVLSRLIDLGDGVACFEFLHGYQKERIAVWLQHWLWDESNLDTQTVREVLRGPGYQPWQALIAMGAGGWSGFGIGSGPQNRYDFLPYRSEDYVFAVVGEETGWFGCLGVLLLVAAIVFGLLGLAMRTRERFGRLVCVGVATWIGTQSLCHVAVCGWLVPATGLPMPLLSYGGSSTLATLLGIAVCLNIGARREPILAAAGFR